MKWRNGETKESKTVRLSGWHKWFAWHPVVIDTVRDGDRIRRVKAWLEFVNRRGCPSIFKWDETCWEWDYAAIRPYKDTRE